MRFLFLLFMYTTSIHSSNNFQPSHTAPHHIAKHSSAVVRLGFGTAIVVQHQQKIYLVTNHHVYGGRHCAREGCYGKIRHHQGQSRLFKKLFIQPHALSKDADIAIFKLPTKPFPNIQPLEITTTISKPGDTIHILGYPKISQQQWSSGHFVNLENKNMLLHAPTLPGSSGSAILNHQGILIGIHHSSVKQPKGERAIDSWSYSTPVETIMSLINNQVGLDQYPSIMSPISFNEAFAIDQIFRNAQKIPQLIDHEKYFSELLTRCLNINTESSDPDIFLQSLEPCQKISDWLLTYPIKTRSQFSYKERKNLHSTMQKIIERSENFHGLQIQSWLRTIAQLDKKNGSTYAYKTLQNHLKRTQPSLTPSIALLILTWLPQKIIPLYQSQNIKNYTLDYQKIPEYPFYALKIAQSAQKLKKLNLIKKDTYKRLIQDLYSDPKINLSVKLKLERFLHISLDPSTPNS